MLLQGFSRGCEGSVRAVAYVKQFYLKSMNIGFRYWSMTYRNLCDNDREP